MVVVRARSRILTVRLCVANTIMTGGRLTALCASLTALTSTEHKPCPQTVDRPLSQSNTASGLDDVGPAPTVLGAENEYIIVRAHSKSAIA